MDQNNVEPGESAQNPASLPDLLSLKQLVDLNITSVPYLWEGIFPEQGIGFITGASDSNKSTFLRQFAYAIINRHTSFLGVQLNVRHGKVLFISTEDNVASVAAMVRKQGANEFPEDIQKRMGFYFKPLKTPRELERILQKTRVDLIGIDTWTDNFHGDLNSTVPVRENLAEFKAVAEKYGCFILGIHHARKGVENKKPDKSQMLGSQGLEAYSRSVLYIRRDGGARREIHIVKGNYTPDELKNQPILVNLNSDTMILELAQVQQGVGNVIPAVREYNKDKFMPIILKLKNDGLSFDKIVDELARQFPGESTPSKGTIHGWLKDINPTGQSAQL